MTREEAKEFIAQSVKSDVDMALVADAIKALEQEPRKGHWIDDTKYGGAECSECGKWYPHATITKSEIKYCSECGARMVEPQESEDK